MMANDGDDCCREKCLNPVVFATYFAENILIHDYDTRRKIDFHTYSVHSEIGKKAIKYKVGKLWNSLPVIKNIKSLRLVKIKLKEHLLQSLM